MILNVNALWSDRFPDLLEPTGISISGVNRHGFAEGFNFSEDEP